MEKARSSSEGPQDKANRRMAGEKGIPKTGGRKKGTPNRLTTRTREELWKYCQERGVNPFEFAVDVIAGDVEGADLQQKLDCAKDLRGYLLPRLKQIEAEVGPETQKVIRFLYGKSS